jgi:hypothetical protein
MEREINYQKLTTTLNKLEKTYDYKSVEDNFPGFYWIKKAIDYYTTYSQITDDLNLYSLDYFDNLDKYREIKKNKWNESEKIKKENDKRVRQLDREIKISESNYAMVRAIKYILYKSNEYELQMKIRNTLFFGVCCNNVSGFICLGCGNIICMLCDKFHIQKIINNETVCITHIWNILI